MRRYNIRTYDLCMYVQPFSAKPYVLRELSKMNIIRMIAKLSVIHCFGFNSRFPIFTPKQGTPNPLFISSSTFHSSTHPAICRFGFEDIKDIEDALLVFDKMLQMKPMPFVVDYNKLLSIIVKMGHYSQVIQLFKKLSLLGCEVNGYTMSIVIHCYCKLRKVELGFAILGYFIKRGFDPNIVSINCLIKGFFLKDNVAEAVRLFKKLMRDKLYNVSSFTISTVTDGLCKSGSVVNAVELLQKLEQKECDLNVVVYNTVLDGLCKAGMVDKAKTLLFEMIDRDILPDVVTYTCLIHGLCTHKELDFARSIFNDLPSKMVYPNVITYNVMIQGLCREGLFQHAKEILDKMEKLGCFPNSVTYNIIIQNCLHHRDSFDSINLLKRIVGKDFQLDAPTFFLLLPQMQIIRQMQGIYDDAVITDLILKLISSDARDQMRSRKGYLIIQRLTQKLVSSDNRYTK